MHEQTRLPLPSKRNMFLSGDIVDETTESKGEGGGWWVDSKASCEVFNILTNLLCMMPPLSPSPPPRLSLSFLTHTMPTT